MVGFRSICYIMGHFHKLQLFDQWSINNMLRNWESKIVSLSNYKFTFTQKANG